MPRNSRFYFDRRGNPRLRRSFCVFLDVLGFHSVMNPMAKPREAQVKFERYYNTLVRRIQRLSSGDGWEMKVFTDNIVLGSKCDVKEEWQFFDLFFAIANHQLSMALEGLFVRGGLTVGPLFMDQNVVYGPALLEAHRLENEIACYPRVVLSDDAKGFVQFQMCYHDDVENAPQSRAVLIDSDGRAFLNYLVAVGDRKRLQVRWKHLRAHKKVVMKNLHEQRRNARVWDKYRWVAKYHNFFCRNLSGMSGYSPDLVIPDSEFDDTPKRLRFVD
jgi:hypothetical protein